MAKGDAREHRVRQLARLFDLDPPPSPRLWMTPDHDRAAETLVPPGAPVLAIGPAANWRGKQWRAERFAELGQRLTARSGPLAGACVAVFAAAHERGQAEPLLAAIPPLRRIDLVGKLDLLTAAAALRRCALFIGNDTGLMHIAAAVGTPTLGLFGPSPIEQYAPWGSRTAVARTADAPGTMFPPGFDHRTTDTLMDSLSVEAAETAVYQLWLRPGIAAA
jgi:ADP-heptose:LPS heptosyltransferase